MNWRTGVAQALREPLLHFALIGLALFGLYSLRAPVDQDSRIITITAPQVAAMAAEWSAGWNRAPTPVEIDGLIRDYVKDEVYTREAKRLGLDRDDLVVRPAWCWSARSNSRTAWQVLRRARRRPHAAQ